MLRHKDCGGNVIISASDTIKLVSPGYKISVRGITPGALEITSVGAGKCGFLCTKCGEAFKESIENIEGMCFACDTYQDLDHIRVTNHLSLVCQGCLDVLSGKAETDDPSLTRMKEVLYIPDSNNNSSISLKTVMMKPVKF